MSPTYCINCGAELADEHAYCPRCGAQRFVPPQAEPSLRPPPSPGSQPFHPVINRPAPAPPRLWLPYVYAAGAVFWLILLAQSAAIVAAPAGREQGQQALLTAGVTHDVSTIFVLESAIVITFEIIAAALHATAYFGLRRKRPWGWITAVIVAAGWSLVLVGIPVFVLLLRRETREAYGIS